MEYREIVSVTGLGGLYQLLATKSDGAIVRDLSDKSTKFISSRLHSVTPLESIEVYTIGDNVRLQHVFLAMQEKESTVQILDPKKADNNAIKTYFGSVFPDFDQDRVYVSDMKKMLKWYEVLKLNDLLKFETQQESTITAEPAIVAATEEATDAEAKPAKKPRKKKTEEKTEE
jgi:hypothetical protein